MAITTALPNLQKSVTEFLSKPRKMLIDGKWVEAASGKTFETYNPATGEVLARVAEGDREDIDRAVKAARRGFESGPRPEMSPSRRTSLGMSRASHFYSASSGLFIRRIATYTNVQACV
jgi:hypothetical protein